MTHPLRVSDDGRLILKADGKPFFWLGDTAWELFHRLTRDDIDHLLTTRARQGFTVIQAVVLAEFDGLRVPNREGHLPLIDEDPAKPNEKYMAIVDYAIDRCEALGLTMGLLPTWGDKVNKAWGEGPEVFTPDNAVVFATYLAKRCRGKPIVWVLGGDRPIATDTHRRVWRRMGEAIRAVVGREQLITFHPHGRASSADMVHHERWLDMNMTQSGHSLRDYPNWTMIRDGRAKEPAKPILDGEPNYEDHPVKTTGPGGWLSIPGQYFDEYDVRKSLYRSLFAGACGYTYGCHDIWQCYDPALNPPINGPRTHWREALLLPGAEQMRHARALMESIAWEKLIPDDTLVSNQGHPSAHIVAAGSVDDSIALIYAPVAAHIPVDLERWGKMTATWFDPRTGERTPVGVVEGRPQIKTPDAMRDWVLILNRG